jgi:vitamin B12 transporter
MPAGYDYSLGVIYPVSKQLEVKLKGENLLDQAHEVPINGVNVPVMERRGLLTMEYTF